MKRERGKFIVVEGADGCGKTTLAERLCEALRRMGRGVLRVRDPGSTAVAEAIRRLLLDPAHGRLSARAEALLYMAARAHLVEEVIRPALRGGTTVVCERWTLSTEVYQGVAGGLGVARVRRLARVVGDGVEPDLVLVLDAPLGGGLARIRRERDRMEAKGEAFHARVVKAYRRLARREPRHVLVPPGTADEVARRALEEVRAVVG